MTKLVPLDQIAGEDAEETAMLRASLEEARSFLAAFPWCRRITEGHFGLGVGGVVAVFLFDIEPAGDQDARLWVVVGDLPSAYLVTDRAPTPVAALRVYCELMDDWVRCVRSGREVTGAFPIAAEPTVGNAELLARRLSLLRGQIIPAFEDAAPSS